MLLCIDVFLKIYKDGGDWINEAKGFDDAAAFLNSVCEGENNNGIGI